MKGVSDSSYNQPNFAPTHCRGCGTELVEMRRVVESGAYTNKTRICPNTKMAEWGGECHQGIDPGGLAPAWVRAEGKENEQPKK